MPCDTPLHREALHYEIPDRPGGFPSEDPSSIRVRTDGCEMAHAAGTDPTPLLQRAQENPGTVARPFESRGTSLRLLVPQQLGAVVRRRMAKNLLEYPVEMRERLESHIERDFANSEVRIQEKVLGFFNP